MVDLYRLLLWIWDCYGKTLEGVPHIQVCYLHAHDIVHIEIYDNCRKPQGAKAKHGIQDWHLMIFVSVLVLLDVIFLILYTLLEGLVDNFGVVQVPNKEKLSSISGVR